MGAELVALLMSPVAPDLRAVLLVTDYQLKRAKHGVASRR